MKGKNEKNNIINSENVYGYLTSLCLGFLIYKTGIRIGVLRGLRKFLHEKCLEQDLSCNKCSIKVSYHCFYCWQHSEFTGLKALEKNKNPPSGEPDRERHCPDSVHLGKEGGLKGQASEQKLLAMAQGAGRGEWTYWMFATHPVALLPFLSYWQPNVLSNNTVVVHSRGPMGQHSTPGKSFQ